MKFRPSRSERRTFGKIAQEYDLVYFGRVDPRRDADYDQIRGLTAQPSPDENYTAGNVYDYAVAFCQRSRKIHASGGAEKRRKWTILQIELKKANLPHALISAKHHSQDYAEFLAATRRFSRINANNFDRRGIWRQNFTVFSRLSEISDLQKILSLEVQEMLIAHFRQFDFEIDGDKLLVYAVNQKISLETLDHMLRVGLWWARILDGEK